MPNQTMFNVNQSATYADVTRATIYAWIKNPKVTLGRDASGLVSKTELDLIIKDRARRKRAADVVSRTVQARS